MHFLMVSDRERFWAHLLPLAERCIHEGHDVTAAVAWSDVHAAGLPPVIDWLCHAGAAVEIMNGHEIPGWLASLSGRSYSAAVVCPEHVEPQRAVRAALGSCPVYAVQHGLCQSGDTEAADAMMCWGEWSANVIRVHSPLRLHVTGTPRFDGYRRDDARDHGFALVHAGHNPKRIICREWIETLRATAFDDALRSVPVAVKLHPNDTVPVAIEGVRVIPAEVHPRDLIRTCSAIYMDSPSTAWIEATRYGKRIVLDGVAGILSGVRIGDVLSRTGAAAVECMYEVITGGAK